MANTMARWRRLALGVALAGGMALSACEAGPADPAPVDDDTPIDTPGRGADPRRDTPDPAADTPDPDPSDTVAPAEPVYCLQAAPAELDLGGTLLGSEKTAPITLSACGDAPVTLTALILAEDSAPSITLSGGPPLPLALQPGESVEIAVTHAPTEVFVDETGAAAPEVAVVGVSSDADPLALTISGFGVTLDSPLAQIEALEDDVVVPQTTLHLSAAQTGGVPLAAYQWSVVQPVGSTSVFLPSSTSANPVFEANVAGLYEFTLRTWDGNGRESPVPANYLVTVTPTDAIHVELLWDTPTDDDQSDEGPEAGADLDLHFALGDVLEQGQDPWFDLPFDCFWFNATPNWGELDPSVDDDPTLDRDDTDGAGPENLNLGMPQDGADYRVAAHHWNDHGFGPSFATVRVYITGELAWELSGVQLDHHDLWDVGTLSWPSGTFVPSVDAAGAPLIITNYQDPNFVSAD